MEAHHSNPDADHVIIDGSEATQVTFIGQVRNISQQTTNVTYKLDDGTGIIEVKQWVDTDAMNNPDDPMHQKPKPTEQSYARVWGRVKVFGGKRHVGASFIRPIQDHNEISYHLLEATAVHLHFTRGPLEELQAKSGANGMANGAGYQQSGGNSALPPGLSAGAKKVLQCLRNTEQTNEGLHMNSIAVNTQMEIGEVEKAGEELQGLGMIYTTVDDFTWAVLDVDGT